MGKTIDDYEEEIDEELENDRVLREKLEGLAKKGLWVAIKVLINSIVGSVIPSVILDALVEMYANYTNDGAN